MFDVIYSKSLINETEIEIMGLVWDRETNDKAGVSEVGCKFFY